MGKSIKQGAVKVGGTKSRGRQHDKRLHKKTAGISGFRQTAKNKVRRLTKRAKKHPNDHTANAAIRHYRDVARGVI